MMEFLTRRSRSISGAALILGAASFAARLLGVLRDRILAGMFGAGSELDAYYAAFRIPDFLYEMIVFSALSAAFIPVLASVRKQESEWRFVSSVFNILGIALIAVALLLFAFAGTLMQWLTPGFSPEQLSLATHLTRILFISPLLLGLSALLASVLQSHQRFFLCTLAPILYNVGIIFGALVFAPIWGITGVAYGVVIGAGLHLACHWWGASVIGFRWLPLISWSAGRIRELLVLGVPRIVATFSNQASLLVLTVVASRLSEGSLAIFSFANNLQSFPLGIIGVSFATAAYPVMTSYGVQGDGEALRAALRATMRQVIFFTVPAGVLLLGLRAQIVRVVLGTGNFDWSDTVLTASALAIFVLSLIPQVLNPLLNRAFYAIKDSLTPVAVMIGSVAMNIVVSLMLAPHFGVLGLVAAYSLSHCLSFTLLVIAFEWKEKSLFTLRELSLLGSVVIGSLGMIVSLQSMKWLVVTLLHSELRYGSEVFLQGFSAGMVGLATYFLIMLLLRVPEVRLLKNFFYDPHS